MATNSTSQENSSDYFSTETHTNKNYGFQIMFAMVGSLSLVLSFIAITVLRRTKRIPKSAKFLATLLLVLDCWFISLTSLNAFNGNPFVSSTISVLGTLAGMLAYTTIAVMAVERVYALHSPMKYIRKCSLATVRMVSCVVLGGVATVYLTLRYGVCFWQVGSMSLVFGTKDMCSYINTFYLIVLASVVIVSVGSYIRIFIIVKQTVKKVKPSNQRPVSNVFKEIKEFTQTSIVLVYLIAVLVTYVVFSILIIIGQVNKIEQTTVSSVGSLLFMCNSLSDSLLYILWFKECQLELLKMISFLGHSIQRKTEP